jgi:hypothetical protein
MQYALLLFVCYLVQCSAAQTVRSVRAEIERRGHQAATGDWRAKPDAEAPR